MSVRGALPDGRRARLPARAADDDPHRRAGRVLRPRGQRRSVWSACWSGPRRAGIEVGVVGSGSNLLMADAGVRGLVVKLDGELARIEHEDGRLICGGGARLPQASARAAALGLSGLEFGVNIPGTVGGAVRMNANAYGGELGRVLEWVDVATAARAPSGARPEQLGFAYRRSNLGAARGRRARLVRARAEPTRRRSRRRSPTCAPAARAAQPSGHQDVRLDLQEPRRPARGGPHAPGQLLEEAGCKGLAGRRRALLAQARELHRERRRHGDHRRRARPDRRGPAARAGAVRRRRSSPRSSCSATRGFERDGLEQAA